MTEITLARALKLKNRLTGQVQVLGQRAVSHNSFVTGTTNSYDTRKVFAQYETTQSNLIEVKTKIQLANAAIQEKIVEIGELRSHIALLKSMNVTEGPQYIDRYGSDEDATRDYTASIGKAERDATVESLEAEIDLLQDEIDTHNATTRVKLSFDL